MTSPQHWCRRDFTRRYAEALTRARKGGREPMELPAVRVVMLHEQEKAA